MHKATIRLFLGVLLLIIGGSKVYAQYEGGVSGNSLNAEGQLNSANCSPAISNVALGGIADGHSYDEANYVSCNLNVFSGGNSGPKTYADGIFANCSPTISNVALGGIADGNSYDEVNYAACNLNIYAGGNSGIETFSIGALANCSPTLANVALGGIADGYGVDTILNSVCTPISSPCSTMVANAGTDVAICTSDSIQLQATGGTSYVWSPSVGLNDDTIANPFAAPGVTTEYVVTVTSDTCSRKDTVVVTVNTKPTPTIAGTTTICNGQSTMLSTELGEAAYLWPSTGATTSFITVSPTTDSVFSVKVFNNFCDTTVSATVTVNPVPVASISGTLSINCGTGTILTASGGSTYLWSTGETTTSITVSPGSNTVYWVEATNAFACTSPKAYETVTVAPLTALITGTSSICSGQSTTLTANGGAPSSTYLWAPGGQTTSAITVSPTNPPSASYDYIVTISDALCPTSPKDTITITVNPLPDADAGSDITICNGASTQIGAPSVGGNTYSWSPAAGLDDPNISDPTATLTSTTTYTLTETITATGCQRATSVTITVVPKAVVSGLTTICSDIDLILTASSGGASPTYLWAPGGETTQIITISAPLTVGLNTFDVTTTDGVTGCVSSDTIDVTVMAAPCASVNIAMGGAADGNALGIVNNVICSPDIFYAGGNGGGEVVALGSFADCTPTFANVALGDIADGHALGILNNINCSADILYAGGVGGGEVAALGSFSDCSPLIANVALGSFADGQALGEVNYMSCNPNILYSGGIGGGEVNSLGSFADCTPSTANVALGGIANGHSLDAPPLCVAIVLPIQLISFDASAINDNQVLCEWETESEINNDYFTVERTIDTKTFSEVGTVSGADNSNISLYYSLIDENPFRGLSYYRLKQTDFDGAFSYSSLLPVHIGLQKIVVSLYPNPTTSRLTVLLSGDEKIDLLITITDMLGKKVYVNKKTTEIGTNRFVINTTDLSGGVYFMNILNTATTEPISLQKFIKVK